MSPTLPLVHEAQPGHGLVEFSRERKAALREELLEHGALLFRGFHVPGEEGFAAFAREVFEPLPYLYRSTPRTEVGKGVYTATEYPKQLTIPQHCENAYARQWPLKLAFFCAVAAPTGGATPLADNRRTTALIPEAVRARFEERGVMYVRNYGSGVDLPWQVVFQTKEKREVEHFCDAQAIQYEWLPKDRLRTRQVCQALAQHPATGERVWFNQAHLFHVSALDPASQKAMLSVFKKEELPRNAYFGDGGEIPGEDLASIRAAYGELHEFPWRQGDVLLVDNMLVSHGRRPFDGPRRILVTMGEPFAPAQQ